MDAGSVESLFAGYPDVRLRLVSRSAHTSQVVTGFLMLARRRRIALTIEDAGHRREEYPHPHLVEAFVGGRRIAFDMLDGYNFDVVAAAAYIRGVDLYFKRSCSTFRNGVFPAEVRAKIRPLGFNYHVTCPENPINPVPVEIKSLRKRLIALLRPRPAEEGEYFTVEKFECGAGRRVAAKRLKILFLTRLWEGEQNRAINAMRIAIVRALGERYPRNFTGGVTDTPLARALCPELIVAEKYEVHRSRPLPAPDAPQRHLHRLYGFVGLDRLEDGRIRGCGPCRRQRTFRLRGAGRFPRGCELPGLCLGRGVRGAGRFADALSRRRAAHEGGQCGLLP